MYIFYVFIVNFVENYFYCFLQCLVCGTAYKSTIFNGKTSSIEKINSAFLTCEQKMALPQKLKCEKHMTSHSSRKC